MKNKNEITLFENEITTIYPDVYKYLLHLGCPKSLSKDITQSTMEKAWVNREKILYVDYKKQWLFKVAFNEYMSYLRETSKEYSYSISDAMMDGAEIERITSDALQLLIRQEDLQKLKEALDRLEPKYLIPIRLRYFGELSHKEISDVLGLNYNTTRSIIARGLMKLKKILIELEY